MDVCGEAVLCAAHVLKQSVGGVGFCPSAERPQTQVSVRAPGAPSLARKTVLFGAAPGLTAARELLVVACGIWFPDQGPNLGPWEHGVLAAGPPGKSPNPLVSCSEAP